MNELIVENRLTNTTKRYYELERNDGTTVALTGPATETLQDGAQVTVVGVRSGAHLTLHEIDQLAQPSASSKARRAATTPQVEGTLLIAHADDFDNGASHYLYHVRDDAGRMTFLGLASLPTELRGGMRVAVSGQLSADASSLRPKSITILGAPAGMVQKSGTLLSPTTNKVLVILANFNNTAAPAYTASQAQQLMSTGAYSVANYYSDVSYGQQLLAVTVTPAWVTMNLAATCSYTSISSAANTAAAALGSIYNASNYDFVVYFFPVQPCGWAGLAYVGLPHQAFLNGTNAFSTSVVAHEMGHNFGLYHAGSLSCSGTTIGGTCSVSEYGDPFDTMGVSHAMHFNATQKSILNWIPSSSVKTHTSGSVNYTLTPIEMAGGATYAIKIPTNSSSRTYWLEYRQPLGFDSPSNPGANFTWPNNGAQLRVSGPFEWASGADDTEVLDMTPGSSGGFGDAALLVGKNYVDSANGINITVTGASPSALTVNVTTSGSTATTTLGSTPNPSTLGANAIFTATVTGSSPTGSVNFQDGSSSVAGCSAVALAGSGNTRTAACTTAALGAGVHSIVATYSGDSANSSSSSSTLSQTVNKMATTTGLAASANPSTAGATVTFTATVSGSSPTGSVNFKDGTTSISGCSAAAVSGSGNIRTATCATSGLTAGTHSISAVYGGDANNNGSSSVTLSQVVNSVSSPTSLVNGSFEAPKLSSGSYQYDPTAAGVGWSFVGSSGIQSNGSAWHAATAPDGVQTGFIQRTGSIAQTLTLSAGSYTLSFQAAQRPSYPVEPVKVTVDGTQVGSLVSPPSTSFAAYTVTFSVGTSGAHTIAFTGTDGSADKDTFIDAVGLNSAGSAAMLANASFEAPALSSGSYQYDPTAAGVGWSFVGSSGIQSNGSAWHAATAPDGLQTAFIQRTGSIAQTVNLSAGSHTLSFQAAQRAGYPVEPVKVTVDGTQVGSLVSPASTSFTAFSLTFSVGTSGAHTVVFAGTDGSVDKDTFIDAVTLQ